MGMGLGDKLDLNRMELKVKFQKIREDGIRQRCISRWRPELAQFPAPCNILAEITHFRVYFGVI